MILPALNKPLIYDLDLPALEKYLVDQGEPPFRANQIWRGIYQSLWTKPEQFTNLPNSLRYKLEEGFTWRNLDPGKSMESTSGETLKTLFYLPGKEAIEAVLMIYNHRNTLCISTQAGCALGCVFCATGQMGFQRHLSNGEIIEQVLYFSRYLSSSGKKTTNVVFMGMGEPFLNHQNTMAAIQTLNHPGGFNLGQRRFTISTVGIIPGIRRFTRQDSQVNLAISLHAADNELRSSLVPVNRKYPLSELMLACLEYVEKTNRRISFEWALINGLNDTEEQAMKLAGLLKPFRRAGSQLCHVNLISLNPTHNYHKPATPAIKARSFKDTLENHGIPCTIRLRRGIEINAGCGQLASTRTDTLI
jgi:23S rRNA (adenine2503-C2)-methyltransferase